MQIKATRSYDHTLGSIKGKDIVYYRINDSKKITDISKYFLVKISVKKIIVLQVGKKYNKYSLVTIEYDDTPEADDKWADSIRRILSNKIVLESNAKEFKTTFELVITKNIEEE